ncbi:MAG: minor capsid protein [Synergistaceae bacterium]|nr:minor capsid protein [Synergistaceae bacterium]
MKKALEAFMKGKKVETSQDWHAIIPEDAVEWLKGYTPTLSGVLEKDILEKVREVVRNSMTKGTSLKQRIEDLQASAPKISAIAEHRVESIARTEVTRADTMGRLIAMKSNPDVLGVEFSAVLDSRTTDICEGRHGLVMRLDDPKLPYNTPPLHVNCRSLLLPATVYEYPDGLLTSHEFEEVPEAKQRPQDIEEIKKLLQEQTEKQEAKAAAIAHTAIVETTILPTVEPQKPEEEPVALPPGLTPTVREYMKPSDPNGTIRGVSKERIDKLRGTRKHRKKDQLTAVDVLQDYRRVGIEITTEDAEEIYRAIVSFTNGDFSGMRDAFLRHRDGKELSEDDIRLLNMYMKATEYARIAPTYASKGEEIFRGIKRDGGDYAKRLMALKVGDIFDLEMASSFSSEMMKSANFAGYHGIMFHVVNGDIQDAPSIRGMSLYEDEYEVLVDDRLWKVTKVVEDDKTQYHFYHIWIERIKGG